MERLHILDGYGYIFRAFYGLMGGVDRRGVRLSTSAGMPTGGLYVYANMLIRLYLDVKPERIAVVFDAPGRTFRDDIDDQYKATRSETPDDLKIQMPYFRPLTEAFCWPVLSVPGVEADDVIATLVTEARARDWDVTIYSADKDIMALVDDHVVMIDAMRQTTYDEAKVTDKFGVPPRMVSDWLAMVGDTSDNIPGMAGVGKVTASKLLNAHGSIDGILANVGSLKGKMKQRFEDPEQLETLERSRKLVTLKRDCELPLELDQLVPSPWDGARLTAMLVELEFQALLSRLDPETRVESEPGSAQLGLELTTARETTPDTEIVLDADVLRAFASEARNADRLAVRVETDGARADRARVIGVAMAIPDRAPVYIPLEHRYLSAPKQLAVAALPSELVDLLADPGVAKVCHDVKATRKALAEAGLTLDGAIGDTMLATYLLDASRDAYAFERVVAGTVGVKLKTKKELLGRGRNAIGFEAVEVNHAAAYSGASAAATLSAHAELERRLQSAELTSLHRDLELPVALLLSEVERVGITLNLPYLREIADRIGGKIAELERRVHGIAGTEINIGSPKQLSALLFDKLGLTSDKMKKTKTGFSTDHEVLESMVEAHEIVRPIIEHRELVKLKGTYIDALPPLVNPRTGRLHTTFAQAVAATGRLSSQEPNLQNIPVRTELGREIRKAFIAAEGKTLLTLDYSQIEMRLCAHLSKDPVLLKAFREDIDVHTQTAAEVFDIPIDEVGTHERRVAKAVNYGLMYGQSPFGLSRTLDIPRSEAQHYIDRYFERFPTVGSFMEDLVERARKTGYAVTVLNRRRPIPDLTNNNFARRKAAERIAQNTPMQGSGADIMKLAMLRVSERLARTSLDATMLLTVHDELVFEADPAQADEVAALVKAEMEGAYELDVPLRVDVGIGKNWDEAAH
jgi:DNA polymerase-1